MSAGNEGDSIRAAERVLKSERFQFVWKLLAPFAYAGIGWLISQAQLGARVAAMKTAMAEMAKAIAKQGTDVTAERVSRQQADRQIGRYTAFAVASSQAYETAKMKAQKSAYAERYAKSYERMVDTGTPADTAMEKLFDEVALP